jgi:hypothetical protein
MGNLPKTTSILPTTGTLTLRDLRSLRRKRKWTCTLVAVFLGIAFRLSSAFQPHVLATGH